MTNLVKRILVGLVGIPTAIGVVYIGGWVFAGAIILLTVLALTEFYKIALSKDASPNVPLGVIWSIVIQFVVALNLVNSEWGLGAFEAPIGILVLLVVGTLATLTAELFRSKPNSLLNVALTVFGVAYITLSMSALLFLREVTDSFVVGTWGTLGTSLVVTLFVSVWSADTVAFFVGRSFGRHKLFERVSPKKSWEGAIGGLVGSVLAFWGMAQWILPNLEAETAILCGAVVGTVGPLGDLSESLLKRDAVVKDSGSILPGHGGVFDRFDSMLFAAPVVAIIVYHKHIIRLVFP